MEQLTKYGSDSEEEVEESNASAYSATEATEESNGNAVHENQPQPPPLPSTNSVLASQDWNNGDLSKWNTPEEEISTDLLVAVSEKKENNVQQDNTNNNDAETIHSTGSQDEPNQPHSDESS